MKDEMLKSVAIGTGKTIAAIRAAAKAVGRGSGIGMSVSSSSSASSMEEDVDDEEVEEEEKQQKRKADAKSKAMAMLGKASKQRSKATVESEEDEEMKQAIAESTRAFQESLFRGGSSSGAGSSSISPETIAEADSVAPNLDQADKPQFYTLYDHAKKTGITLYHLLEQWKDVRKSGQPSVIAVADEQIRILEEVLGNPKIEEIYMTRKTIQKVRSPKAGKGKKGKGKGKGKREEEREEEEEEEED